MRHNISPHHMNKLLEILGKLIFFLLLTMTQSNSCISLILSENERWKSCECDMWQRAPQVVFWRCELIRVLKASQTNLIFLWCPVLLLAHSGHSILCTGLERCHLFLSVASVYENALLVWVVILTCLDFGLKTKFTACSDHPFREFFQDDCFRTRLIKDQL